MRHAQASRHIRTCTFNKATKGLGKKKGPPNGNAQRREVELLLQKGRGPTQVALDGVKNDRLVGVGKLLHAVYKKIDCGLEIGLLRIHH
jgi:hypothetical protein